MSKELERMWKEEVFALFARCNCSRSMEGITGRNHQENVRITGLHMEIGLWDIMNTQSRCSSNSEDFGCFEYKRVL